MKKLAGFAAIFALTAAVWGDVLDTSVFTRQCTFTLAGYRGSESLSDFPVLIRLSSKIPGFVASECGEGGAGLRFTDFSGNVLAHEVDTWNPAGESLVWVRVPTLQGRETRIRLYYGAPAETVLPTVTPSDVWNAYVLVVHGASDFRDSSPKGLNVTNGGGVATRAAGNFEYGPILGNGFNKAAKASIGINIPNPVLNGTLSDPDRFTLSTWLRYSGSGTACTLCSVKGWGDSGFLGLCEGGNYLSIAVSGNHQGAQGLGKFSTAMWNHVAFSYETFGDTGSLNTYFDGSAIYSNSNAKPLRDQGFANWTVGSYVENGSDDSYMGDIDEIRLYDGIASADWIGAEHDTVSEASFAEAFSVVDLTARVPTEFVVTGEHRTAQRIELAGSLRQLATGADTVTVSVKWGTTAACADGVVNAGTYRDPANFTCSIPAADPAQVYYYQVVVTDSTGVTQALPVTRSLGRGASVPLDTTPFKRACTFTVRGYRGVEALTDFPVLVRLSTALPGFSYSLCAPDGSDICFADMAGNQLPHEIDVWNPTGESAIWVKVPTLNGTDTRVRMYFCVDDAAALPRTLASDVWSAYAAVVHGNGLHDSSPNGLGVVNGGGLQMRTDGLVGGAFVKPVETRAQIGLGVPNLVSNHLLSDPTRFSFSGWFRTAAAGTTAILASSKSTWDGIGFMLLCERGKWMSVGIQSKHHPAENIALGALVGGTWNHVAFSSVSSGTINTYFDGGLIYATTEAKALAHEDRTYWGVGSMAEGASGNNFAGDFDEVRFYDGIASADWIKAEYDAIMDPTFVTGVSVENLVDVLPSAVTVSSAARGETEVAVKGSLWQFATGASSVSLRLVWGTTPAMTDGALDLGTFQQPAPFTCAFPVADQTTAYYYAFEMTSNSGTTDTSETFRLFDAATTALWRPSTADDMWTSVAWLLEGETRVFQQGWNVAFDGAESPFVETVRTPVDLDLGTVKVSGDKNYTLAGEGAYRAKRVEKTGAGTLTVDGAGFGEHVEWDVSAGTLRLGDGVNSGAGKLLLGKDSAVTVHGTGALDINLDNAKNQAVYNDATRTLKLKIEGAGPDGKGALVNNAKRVDGWNEAIGTLELTGDAAVGGTARLDVRPFNGTGSLAPTNGVVRGPEDATLTVLNTRQFTFNQTTVERLGAIRPQDGGKFVIETGADMNLARGVELGDAGIFFLRYATIGTPVTVLAGATAHFGGDAETSYLNAPLTVQEGATLAFDAGGELALQGGVVNNGTLLAFKSGTVDFSSPVEGSFLVEQTGGTVCLDGNLNHPDLLVTGTTTGGNWTLGRTDGYGYPNIAGVDFAAAGNVYLRPQADDTLDARWQKLLAGTGPAGGTVLLRTQGDRPVTTTMEGIQASIGQLWLGRPDGAGHLVLAGGTQLTTPNLSLGADGTSAMTSSLKIETGSSVTVTGTGADLQVARWSGAGDYHHTLTVDGGTLDAAGAEAYVGADGPYADLTLNDGALKVRRLTIRQRLGELARCNQLGAHDARYTQKGGTLTLGADGITSGEVYVERVHADLQNGTIVNEGDWTMGLFNMNVFFGNDVDAAGDVTFDLNGHAVKFQSALAGNADVALVGGGEFTSTHLLKSIPLGQWTVDTGVKADLSGAAGFAGGLRLAESAEAAIDIAGTSCCEFGIFPTNFISATSWAPIKTWTGVYPMMVDRLDYLQSHFESGPSHYSVASARGQFYVEPNQAGTWTFAGGYDDHILLEVDGADVLKNESWNAIASASTQLTAGWHDFRVFAFDKAGGAGSPVEGWAEVMNLGWTLGVPGDPNDARNYQRFDPTTLEMRAKPMAANTTGRLSVRWQRAAYNQDTWDSETHFLLNDKRLNSLMAIHQGLEDFPMGSASTSRFTGRLYVPEEQAGTWDVVGSYDDGVMFALDGERVGTSGAALCSEWSGKATVTAGWHDFEVRVSDRAGATGGRLTDSEGNRSALNIAINGYPAKSFDERHFTFGTNVMVEQAAARTGLGGTSWVAEGGVLKNRLPAEGGPLTYCPVYGSLGGGGRVVGPFRFTGGTLALKAVEDVLEKPTFESPDEAMFADLGAISIAFDQRPRQARYVVDRAYGLSAAAAKDVKVSVTINGATPHEEELYQKAFRATVIDGELVLINAGPAGFTLFFR